MLYLTPKFIWSRDFSNYIFYYMVAVVNHLGPVPERKLCQTDHLENKINVTN